MDNGLVKMQEVAASCIFLSFPNCLTIAVKNFTISFRQIIWIVWKCCRKKTLDFFRSRATEKFDKFWQFRIFWKIVSNCLTIQNFPNCLIVQNFPNCLTIQNLLKNVIHSLWIKFVKFLSMIHLEQL